MSDLFAAQRMMAGSASLRRAIEGPTPEQRADAILAQVENATGLGLDMDIRHLAGQIRRQRALPRDPACDGRFLLNLEHALRDLAVRAPVAS